MDCSAVSAMSNHTRGEWLTSQIPPEHKVENEETVFVVLESISQVNNEWMIDLEKANVRSFRKTGTHGSGLMVICVDCVYVTNATCSDDSDAHD